MRTLPLTLKANARVALVICVWFLLASTGYLLWLHRILALAGSAGSDLPVLALGYLAQAIGIGVFLVVARKTSRGYSRATIICAIGLYIAALAFVAIYDQLAPVFAVGWLANVLSGVFQGYYLMLLAARVERTSRGTVFGCSYALSTFLTLLISLPGNGMLSTGIPCLACCIMLAALVLLLLYRGGDLMADKGEKREQRRHPSEGAQRDRKTVLLVGSALVTACFVHAIGFSFPSDALASNVNLELSRILYGIGIAAIGIAADHDRRFALVACAAAFVMPFLMLSLSGAGAANALLWSLGYLLTGAYVLFCVLIAADLAEDAGRPDQAGAGMFARYVGDAAGASLCFALSGNPTVLIGIASAAFLFAVMLFILLYRQVFAPQSNGDGENRRKQDLLELFAARHALTLRERDVLRLVVAGKSNAEIASELVISERTVKFHMTNLLKKTGCKTRLDVIAQFAELENSPGIYRLDSAI